MPGKLIYQGEVVSLYQEDETLYLQFPETIILLPTEEGDLLAKDLEAIVSEWKLSGLTVN